MAIISIPTNIGGINLPGGPADGPLGALYKNDGLDFVQYPRDLGNSTRNHSVFFTIKEQKQVPVDTKTAIAGTQSLAASFMEGAKSFVSSATSAAVTVAESGIDILKSENKGETALNVGANLAGSITGLTVDAANAVKQFAMEPRTDPVAHIALYMPEDLTFSQSANYDESSLHGIVSSLPGIKHLQAGADKLLSNEAIKVALNRAGYVYNPQQLVLFKGVEFREFSLSFTFTPYSTQEAAAVKKIIKLFRSYSSPTIMNQSAGMFFKPPAIVSVDFQYNGKKNPNIPQFKDSVIKNIEVNYGPNGWSAHTDGSPVQTTLTMQFQEIVIVDKTEIDNGY